MISFTGLGIIEGFLGWILFYLVYLMAAPSSVLYSFGATIMFVDIILIGQNYSFEQHTKRQLMEARKIIKYHVKCSNCGQFGHYKEICNEPVKRKKKHTVTVKQSNSLFTQVVGSNKSDRSGAVNKQHNATVKQFRDTNFNVKTAQRIGETIPRQPKCPDCGSADFWSRGTRNGKRQLHCKRCGRYYGWSANVL